MISIIIPFKYSPEHYNNLLNVINQLSKIKTPVEIIIPEQVSDIITTFPAYIKHLKANDTGLFNKSRLFNLAVNNSQFDYIMMWDCDILFKDVDKLDGIFELINHYEFIKPFDHLIDLNPDESITSYDITRQTRMHLNICSACWIMKKQTFKNLGGFDENLIGWGGEDSCLAWCIANSDLINNSIQVFDTVVLHQWHPSNANHTNKDNNDIYFDNVLSMSTPELKNYIQRNISKNFK